MSKSNTSGSTLECSVDVKDGLIEEGRRYRSATPFATATAPVRTVQAKRSATVMGLRIELPGSEPMVTAPVPVAPEVRRATLQMAVAPQRGGVTPQPVAAKVPAKRLTQVGVVDPKVVRATHNRNLLSRLVTGGVFGDEG